MTESTAAAGDIVSLKRHSMVGAAAVILLVGGLGLWSSSTRIAGAVIAGGTIVVDTYSKLVQHQDGGIVKEIFVGNEQTVAQGQVLLRLDDTAIKANIGVLQAQLDEALGQQARLIAELAGTAFVTPSELEHRTDDPSVARILETQRDILSTTVADRVGRSDQLQEQIRQLEHEIGGLQMQQQAVQQQINILSKRSKDLDGLYANNLVAAGDVSQLHLQLAAEEGESGRLVAAIATAKASIAEKTLQVRQIQTTFRAQALDEMQKIGQSISELRQQIIAAEDKLARTEIRSPQAGVVHESIIHTVGGVVAPGQTLMEIVPQADELFASVRVDPMDVDQLVIGQKVSLRISGLEQRTTPEIPAEVQSISPDLIIDQPGTKAYYAVRVRLDGDALAQLPNGSHLLPGMPVQAFALTSDRTVLDYLVRPFAEQLELAMRQ